MFYKNLKKHKTIEREELVFSIFDAGLEGEKDDSVAKPTECKSLYNLCFNDGALKTGLGFRDLRVPATVDDLDDLHVLNFADYVDKVENIWVERWYNTTYEKYIYQLLVMDSKFDIYGVLLIDPYDGLMAFRTDLLESAPVSHSLYRLEDADLSLFFSTEGLVAIGQKKNTKFKNVPAMISCAVHYDNFFGIVKDNKAKLVYTNNVDITAWSDEAKQTLEFLDNRGAFTKLVVFNDYVYLFREHGITKLSIYTTKSDFSVTHLYTSTSTIFEDTVCVCGDKVFFLTRDGLYTFNGSSVKKISQEYDQYFKKFDNSNCSCACLDGKYYLATKCNFDDGESVGCESGDFVNNVLFEIDVNSFELNVLRGVDIKKILAIDTPYYSKLIACFNDKTLRVGELCFNGKLLDDDTKKEWKSFKTDLGRQGKLKRLKELLITTKNDCEIEILSDEETKIYKIFASEKEQRLPISICGKSFQFCFKTNAQTCDIKKPKVVFEVV